MCKVPLLLGVFMSVLVIYFSTVSLFSQGLDGATSSSIIGLIMISVVRHLLILLNVVNPHNRERGLNERE